MKNILAASRQWLFPNDNILGGVLLLFFASAFVLSPATLWTYVFYVGFLPVALYSLVRKPPIDWKNPCLIISFMLILWSALTLLWGEDPGKGRVLKYGLGAFFTAAFVYGLLVSLRRDKAFIDKIGSVFIVMGGLNAVFSIIVHLFFSTEDRLTGWAETRHAILGALVIAISYIFALHRFLNAPGKKYLYGAVAFICLIFVALTQSRGPYVSIMAATFILCMAATWRQQLTVAGGCILLLTGLVLSRLALSSATPVETIQKVSERGSSHRLDIWSFTYSRIAERPWTGHGPAAYLGMDLYTFPHDLYLSTLFYNGLIGLTLLAALLGWTGFWLLRQWRKERDTSLLLALFVCALCGGLTDLGQLTPGPAPLWFILWLPLCLIIARMPKRVC